MVISSEESIVKEIVRNPDSSIKPAKMSAKKEASKKKTTKSAKTSVKKKSSKKKRASKKSVKKKILVIVESPAKAKTINKYLGSGYVIEACMGHIIDLPKSRMAVDVLKDFEPEYITVRGRAKILNRLKKLAGSSSQVLLAADPDREGEAISWHLKRALTPKNPDIKRIEFNEITKTALQEAVKNPREIDDSLVNAQQARRILDRLVGYSISPLLWKKVKRGLSAGRVQSIALKLVCEREQKIDDFKPEEYWSLDARFQHGKSQIKSALHFIEGKKISITNSDQMDQILKELDGEKYTINKIVQKQRKRSPTAPYTTSRLQQDAANKLSFTSQKTMMVAQQLYEGIELGKNNITGLITYMRTDSTRVAPHALEQLRNYIKSDIGEKFLAPDIRSWAKSKSAQDAHEAIRPTDPKLRPESISKHLTKDQLKLYTLIWQKYVSAQMTDELSNHTSVDILAGNKTFRATGRQVIFTGFTEVFNPEDKKKKENVLPDLQEGQELKLKKLEPEQHFTQPPPRYSDASMVKTLEECGVGRPSTYAPTIGTLLKRFYVTRVQRSLKPTELGLLVNRIMCEHFKDLVDVEFTSSMENNLDQVADSAMNWVNMLGDFYNGFEKTLHLAQDNIEDMKSVLDEPTDYVCEKCGTNMVKKIGRFGYFLACPKFPDCRNAKPIPLGDCPTCEDGKVIKRSTKRGRAFFGCSNYPECEFATWDKPAEGEMCPDCGHLLFEKSSREKGRHTICHSCDYVGPAIQSA